jgi:serine protease Do
MFPGMKVTPFVLAIAFVSFISPAHLPAQTNRPNLELVRQLNDAFVQVVDRVSPAVVVLTVTEKKTVFAEPDPKMDPSTHEYWRKFHGQFDDEPQEGKGSGIIVRTNGFILTNAHVIEDAEKIEARLFDGRTFIATVRGIDRQSDVAVLKIESDGLPVASFGDSSQLRVGEFAIAIGAPFSLDYSATFGHISAKNRSNVVPFYLGQMMDQDFIQTDANINPGNSGGPLVNIDGEVIGVNTLIRGSRTGIGFAIPINLAREIAERLIAEGQFIRPWLGVEIRALRDDPETRVQMQDIHEGVVVKSILPESPAASSELRAGDIITEVNGKHVRTAQQLRGEIRSKAIGQSVTFGVFRLGKTMSVEVKLGQQAPPEPGPIENESEK